MLRTIRLHDLLPYPLAKYNRCYLEWILNFLIVFNWDRLGLITSEIFTVASWLVHSSLDAVVRVRALTGDIVLRTWARHLTFTVLLSTQVYKWVPANLMLGVTLQWTSIPGGVEILLVALCYGNRDKLWPDGPLGLYTDFTDIRNWLQSNPPHLFLVCVWLSD